jgi:hypothetical protein
MGGFNPIKTVKKAAKSVTKTISKVVKKTAQAIKKVGKSVMKGIAKISNKLGPVGMIALSIAMPYALAGLSSFTTAAMASNNVFLQAVGQVGNVIRTGYQAFNAGVSNAFSSITNSISQAFTKFAPQGVKDMYSAISEGAKTLYNSAQETVKQYMPKPFTGTEGTVEFFDEDGIQILKSSDASSMIQQGKITAGDLGQQTLSEQTGWFTKANKIGVESDKIVSETINKAYANRLEGFGPNATRMFNDVKSYSEKMGTYINDEQIGSFVENNVATKSYSYQTALGDMDMVGTGPYKVATDISDLTKTGDYISLNEEGTEFMFTGKETFKSPPVKSAFEEVNKKAKDKIISAGKGYIGSLLSPGTTPTPQQPSYYAGATGMDTDVSTGYGGTDIKGTAGGNLVAQVFGEQAANRISNYYRNMNILSSVG